MIFHSKLTVLRHGAAASPVEKGAPRSWSWRRMCVKQQNEEELPHPRASRPADIEKKHMERSIVVGWISEEEKNGAAAWNGSHENHFRERRSGNNLLTRPKLTKGTMSCGVHEILKGNNNVVLEMKVSTNHGGRPTVFAEGDCFRRQRRTTTFRENASKPFSVFDRRAFHCVRQRRLQVRLRERFNEGEGCSSIEKNAP
ncbi:hypothetical protein LR48_Vigan04g061900 [Vigna angularis]|uniref:Uncharacterized protein n=1 Tax=Phaseolus angularis TaxID=3914 RepID=A0A0L9UCI0_PHAAN|nr:hypothetical protein LR48_Vigan04g061900 [Vigna angularis]